MSFHKFIPHIEAARLAGEKILRAAGLEPEPAEVTYAIEAARWFWKPQKTRWLVIADSTVFTSAADLTAPEWQLCRQAIIPEFAAPETIPCYQHPASAVCTGGMLRLMRLRTAVRGCAIAASAAERRFR